MCAGILRIGVRFRALGCAFHTMGTHRDRRVDKAILHGEVVSDLDGRRVRSHGTALR